MANGGKSNCSSDGTIWVEHGHLCVIVSLWPHANRRLPRRRLQDDGSARYPYLPKTPLYPQLYANTPAPSSSYIFPRLTTVYPDNWNFLIIVTIPGFPFPPYTPLFPPYHHIQAYHHNIATHFNLHPYIHFNHSLESAYWVGNSSKGFWELSISTGGSREEIIPLNETSAHNAPHRSTITRHFDHLVVAIGHYHYPRLPPWATDNAAKGWLQNAEGRRILHSIYFREPEEFAEKVILVVGAGASGRDIATQLSRHAKKVCLDHHPNHICFSGCMM